jgi:MFS family permease
MQEAKTTPYEVLKIKEFKYFILGRFIFIMGLRMTGTVIGWWVYQLTESPLALGLVGLSEVIPAVSLALYAGHYIDRNENRSLLLKCTILYICCVVFFLFLSHKNFEARFESWTVAFLIFGTIGITGAIRAFSGPTFAALIAKIVPRQFLSNAAAISSASWLVASVVGHAAAGFLIAFMGIHNSFFVILSLLITGYFLLNRLSVKPVIAHVKNTKTWQSVKEGLKYVYQTKEILGALSLDLFAVLFGGAVALIPVFAKDILHVGPIGFGWLNSAIDMGSIITVTALTILPLRKKQGKILLMSVAGFGIFTIIFAFSEMFWLSFIALFLSGMLDGVSVVVRGTILQLKTPDELRGRVMSVNSMFINSSNELGQFESGIAAKLMGVVPSVVFGGLMTIGVVIATWFKSPSLRKMEY